ATFAPAVQEASNLAADPELERASRRDRREHRVEGAVEPAGGEVRVLGRRIDRTQSPEGEGAHDGLQSLAVRRQLVDPGSRRRIEPTLAQQPARLQVLEPSREDGGADPRQAGREV